MSGCCGQGPVIVSGATPTPRVDVETLLLCDVLPDGTVAGLALVEPVYDTVSGDRVGTRIVDPTTGAAYTPTGTLGVCGAPDQCARQISTRTRCDDADGDGTGEITYTEVWALDPCTGDAPTLLGAYQDGDFAQPYTPVAPVDCPEAPSDTPVVLGTVCYDLGAGATGTAAVLKCAACGDPAVTYLDVETGAVVAPSAIIPCLAADTSSLLLCDIQADGTSAPFLRHYTTDGTTTTFADTQLDGATAYAPTGTVGACLPANDCESPTTPTATVGLCLADGTPIAVTVVRDCEGTVTSEGWINLLTGTFSAGAPPVGTVACGESQSIQLSGTFCDVDTNGDVVGLVLIEYSYAPDGSIDSVRLVDAVTGTTYVPTGTITVCPAGVEQPEQDLLLLCDVAPDGTSTPFVRDYRRDEAGAIVGHTDYTPDGAAYAPTGTVGVCGPDTCTNTTSVLLCDAPDDSTVTVTPTITDGVPADVAQTQFPALAGPYTSLWSGGSLAFPADPGPAQSHRMAVGKFVANPAGCDGASGTLTVSVRVTQNGPGTGQLWDGALRLFRGTTLLGDDPVAFYAPPGHVQTLTLSTPVTAADLAAGDIRVALALETFHGTAKGWTADQFTATVDLEGCDVTAATQFLRHVVTDCETGEVVSQTDTTLDGAPYTVTGDVAQCQPVTAAPDCRDCETLLLCDEGGNDPATIRPRGVSSGSLANGVTWSARGSAPLPSTYDNADGAWWGLASFPNPVFPNSTWTFSRPATVEFSVYVRYFASGTAGDNTAQLPAGLEVVSLPDGFAYDPVTGILTATAATGDDPCTYLTDPHVATSARFRTPNPVTSVTAQYLGPRIAVCGQFGSYRIGAFQVTPPGQFLRTICRGCDGAASSVLDTELDGTTAYTPLGTVSQCGAQNTEPTYDVEPLLLCDTAADGSVTEFLRHYVYTDASGIPTSHRDTALDGTTTYTPAGTVGQCEPASCELTPICVRPSGRVEFLSNPAGDTSGVDADWTWGQSLTGPWFPTYRVGVYPGWTTVDPGTAEGAAHWIAPHPDSQLANTGQPGEGPAITAGTPDWYGRASFQLPSFADPATIRISATALNADQLAVEWRLNGGAWQPVNSDHTQPPYTLAPTAVPGAQAGVNEIVVHVRETVFPTGAAGILLHVIAEYDVDASAYLQWTQVACTDGTLYYLDEAGVRQDALPDGATVVPCPGAEACSTVQLRQLCDLGYTPQPPIPTPNGAFTRTGNVKTVGAGLYYSGGNATPNGVATLPVTGLIGGIPYTFRFSTSWAGSGVPNPAAQDAIYLVEILDGATVIASQQRNISNGAGAATGYVDEAPLLFTAPTSGAVTVRVSDKSTGNGADRDLIVIPAEVRAESLSVTTTPFLRAVTFGCDGQPTGTTDWELDGTTPYTVAGAVAACDGEAADAGCAKQVVERCGCDDTDGDGIGDVTYTELWAVDPCGGADPALLGTYLDGDLTQPYTPTAPVDCTAADALPGPLSTGVRAVTGTAAQDIAGTFPGVQSVSLTVVAGAVNATMSDGAAVPIPAGVTMTWSVAQDSDTALAVASFAGATAAASYLLNWTYR